MIFDDNSFINADDVVTVEVLNAYYNDMLWLNTDALYTFISADTGCFIRLWRLQLTENMNYQFNGEIYFDHTPVLAPELPNHFLFSRPTYPKRCLFWGN
ncbi:MAG: hypothetical protein R2764_08795 [Bacteroidales bacterium]